jgi:serine phosphatase RsbU (regulator of sigma subunit)
MAEAEPRQLQCTEVWGGNQAVSTTLTMPGLDVWLHSQPDGAAESGGDVHYASSCAAGALSRMLIADVSGHGAGVSDIARRLRKLMRRHINQHRQTGFVRSMNQEFASLATMGHFATAVAYTYDAPSNRLEVCVAGHPPPLIYRRASRSWSYMESPEEHRAGNIPLGIEESVDYQQFNVDVEVGDLVLTYTDALPEARLGALERLEAPGLLRMVNQVDADKPAAVIERLVESVKSTAKIEDDLTLLLFRPNGTRPKVPLRDFLLAPFRMARAVALSYAE